jgi:DDE superfamily endonuclease
MSSLCPLIDNLPFGKFVMGDNAYGCLEHLLTPFAGHEKTEPIKDVYNFYCSQRRIRIEMVFGLMVTKWRILKSPSQVQVKKVGTLFLSITRMHNYCINENPNDNELTTEPLDYAAVIYSNCTTSYAVGQSLMREIIMANLQSEGLHRPDDNLEMNRDNE